MSKEILFVCTGNTCRSPMAEAIYNTISPIKARSAGISVSHPTGAAKNACIAVEKYNASLKNHLSSQLTLEDLEEYKLIITMTASQRDLLRSYINSEKIITLADFAFEGEDVSDPYGGSLELYEKTAKQIYGYILKGIIKRCRCVLAQDNDTLEIARMEKEYFPDNWSENSIKTQIENKRIIVLKYNGNVLGYCIFMVAADEGEILRIATRENMRRSGLGKKLLSYVICKLQEENCSSVFLEVRAGNSGAIALYESLGFLEIGIRKGYYRDNGEDAKLFKLEIKER
ncbi:MAG: ribosomal protein S18-alanine N-acetyltransferase [Clostridia bacterium]|nr:ribosomal protein S18-alanine N-acetyltransferase [Clostridia bacterium]